MTDETETYGGPFIVPESDEIDIGITTDKAARALAEAGLDRAAASAFFRNQMTAGRLHPYSRLRTDKRRPYLFRSDQVLNAAIFHRMTEAGLAGEAVFHTAGRALNSWNLVDDLGGNPEDIDAGILPEPPAPTPSAAIFRRHLVGLRGHQFEIATYRDSNFGTVAHSARLRHAPTNAGTTFHFWGPDFVLRSVFALELDPILAHIVREKAVN